MVSFVQGAPIAQTSAIFILDPQGALSPEPGVPPAQIFVGSDVAIGVDDLVSNTNNKPVFNVQTWTPGLADRSSGGFNWFESFHVVPREFIFGNLLSDQSVPVEVFSSFRRDVREWTSFVNNAGVGTTLSGAPTLPTNVAPMNGVLMSLEVSTVGEPFVDTTLDWGFTGIGTIFTPIEIQRIVLWAIVPEATYTETLGFLSQAYRSIDGTEKRDSKRKEPRQSWGYTFIMEEGIEAQTLENLLFDFQARQIGVPVWLFDARLTADAPGGSTVINVESTAFRDFRVGGLAVLAQSQTVFDVSPITAIGPTSITLAGPTVNSYTAGEAIYPLTTAFPQQRIPSGRYPVGLRTAQINFRSTQNDVDLADLSAFSSFNGKLLLDTGNVVSGGSTKRGEYRQSFNLLDGLTGDFVVFTDWNQQRPTIQFTMRAEGREAMWNMRQMAYALRGRQKSFYIPTDDDSLEVKADLLNASNTMDVENVGYAQFVRQRPPKNAIRITFNDGSPTLTRNIIDSTIVDPSTDRLTVDVNWPATFAFSTIERVDYLWEVRSGVDEYQIKYTRAPLLSSLGFPLVSLFE